MAMATALAAAASGAARAADASFAARDEAPLAASASAEDPPASAPWSAAGRYARGNYQWLAERGALDVSLLFDTPGRVSAWAANSRLPSGGPFVQTLPTLHLDLRDVDTTSRRGLGRLQQGGTAGSDRRVGIEWKPAEQQLLFLRQGLGVRLSGDDRLTMRLRRGTVGLYMKRDF